MISMVHDPVRDEIGEDADLEIRPERQNVMVRVRPGGWARVTETTSEFYARVEDAVGIETFMSIWIDFASAKPPMD